MGANVRGPYRKDFISVRRDGFQYKRAVPKELQAVIGRKTWTRWLCGPRKGRAAADQKARELAVEHDKIIARLIVLIESERQQIAAAGGLEAWQAQNAHAGTALAFTAPAADHLKPDPEAPDEVQAQTALEAYRARERLACVQAETAAAKRIARKLEGEPDSKMLALVDVYEKKPLRSYKTAEKARLYVTRFVAIVGDIAPRDVTPAHVRRFRDALEAEGVKPANIAQHLAKLKTLFNVALSEGKCGVTINPAHKIKAPKADVAPDGALDEGKQGFDAAQMRRIFDALPGESADFQWIVKLLAYHGARSGEICQLRCRDIATLHGVSVLRIRGRVKNRQSIRDILSGMSDALALLHGRAGIPMGSQRLLCRVRRSRAPAVAALQPTYAKSALPSEAANRRST
jgi:integrase